MCKIDLLPTAMLKVFLFIKTDIVRMAKEHASRSYVRRSTHVFWVEYLIYFGSVYSDVIIILLPLFSKFYPTLYRKLE